MNKILNQAQARAVADAMCALNNVYGRIAADVGGVLVQEGPDGVVTVGVLNTDRSETYSNQNEFLTAYGVAE